MSPKSSSGDESRDDGSPSSSPEAPALATTRERRSNAGNKMAKLIEHAAAEDALVGEEEYGEIFQETADDNEFEGDAEDGDVDMSASSSEEDDEGQDEFHGEKELRKAEGGSRKRKNLSLLQQTLKLRKLKHVPVLHEPVFEDQAGPSTVLEKPKKKPERTSWLPEGSTRASSRKLAVASKQATHQRLKEHEKKRVKTLAQMEAAEARKKANQPKIFTQEERLAMAAEVERENTTSVNRWERDEQIRQEDRKARLDALKNQRLEGPVITYWSGPAIWENNKLKMVGKKPVVEVVEERHTPKPKKRASLADTQHVASSSKATGLTVSLSNSPKPNVLPTASQGSDTGPITTVGASNTSSSILKDEMDLDRPSQAIASHSQGMNGFLEGIELYASLPPTTPASEQIPKTAMMPGQASAERQTLASILSTTSSANMAATTPSAPPTILPPQNLSEHQSHGNALSELPFHQEALDLPAPVPVITELATRSLIVLKSFAKLDARARRADREQEEEASQTSRWGGARVSQAEKDRELLTRTLFSIPPAPDTNRIMPCMSSMTLDDGSSEGSYVYDPLAASSHPRHNQRYLSKRATLCAITGHLARYRDPTTELPYASSGAYKNIKRILNDETTWNDSFKCWVGEVKPAKGFPTEIFLGTVEKKKNPKENSSEQEKAAQSKKDLLADPNREKVAATPQKVPSRDVVMQDV